MGWIVCRGSRFLYLLMERLFFVAIGKHLRNNVCTSYRAISRGKSLLKRTRATMAHKHESIIILTLLYESIKCQASNYLMLYIKNDVFLHIITHLMQCIVNVTGCLYKVLQVI